MADIYNGFDNRIVEGTDNADKITNRGSTYVLIDGGDGNDYIRNSGGYSIIGGGAGNDSIENYGYYSTIDGGEGDDYIYNSGDYILFKYTSGDGSDTIINNGGYYATIDGGNGDDVISNDGLNAYIDGGLGDDYIVNGKTPANKEGFYSSVDGGADDDYIYNSGNNVTITGGKGNDSITNSGGENILFKYATGDGNDLISGFNATSTLQIGNGFDIYSTMVSGDDVIVTVGEGAITLKGAASLGDELNITGTFKNNNIVTDETTSPLTLGSNVYVADASARTKAVKITGNALDNSIVGGSGRDTLYGKDGNDTLYGGVGNDTLSGGEGADLFIYKSGKDVITDFSEDDTLRIGTGKYAVRKSGDDVIVMVGDGNITLKDAASLETVHISGNDTNEGSNQSDTFENYFDGVTINALGGNDSIENWGVSVIVSGGNDNDKILNGGDGSALFGDAGNDTIENWASDVSIDGGAGNDSINNDYGENISIVGGMGKDTFFSRGDDVSIDGGADNDILRKYSGSNVVLNGGDGKDKIYNYEGENVSIDGGEGNDYILSAKTSSGTSIDAGDGNDSISNASSQATISGSAGDDSIKNTAANVFFAYSTGEGDDLIQGFRADSTLQIGDGTDTYSKATDGNDIIVTVGDGKITLTGAASLKTVNIAGEEVSLEWRLNGTTATYGTASNTLVTVSGVKSLDGISLKDKVVTISAASLGTSKVTISSGYTLALGAGVAVPKTVAASYDAGTMTYTGAGKTAGYSLSNNAISYSAGTSKQFTFSGIADSATTKGFYVNASKKTIAIGAVSAKTDGTPVKLLSAPDGYKMELGSSLSKAATEGTSTLEDGLYTAAGQTAGYTLSYDAKTIKYREALDTAFELNNVATEPTAPSNGVVTLKLANFDKSLSIVGNDAEYAFSIANGTYTGKTFTGSTNADTITNAGTNLIINAGKGDDEISSNGAGVKINAGAGNDKITNSGANVTINGDTGNDTLWGGSYADTFVYNSGDGKDIIGGFDDNDLLQITGTFTTAYDSATGTIKFTIGTGSITLTDFTATTFNVNGEDYHISGSKLVK